MSSSTIKEKDIQDSICAYLSLKKLFFWRQNVNPIYNPKSGSYRKMPKYSLTGVPDIILIKDGKFWGLEVKRPKGKQSPNQVEFEERCKKAGGEYHVVTSLEDINKIGL